MQLRVHRQGWNDLSEVDPLWAILGDPDKRNLGWNVSDFFLARVETDCGTHERMRTAALSGAVWIGP